jgi:accessory gene regulator B
LKKFVLNYCLKIIKQNNSDISEVKLEEIKYGLEGIYLTLTKTIFIFLITYVLGIFKEMIIMLFTFNILRTTGFGIHAKKSWQCWISSTILFIFFPFISKYIYISNAFKIVLGIIAIVVMFLYAPADTVKHPLVNKKKRLIWKIMTVINCIILVLVSICVKDNAISNLMIFGIYSEVIVIIPLTYKIFDLPYNNYKNYGLNSNV